MAGRCLQALICLIDAKSFLKFLKMAHQKFGKICMIVDRAVQHRKSKIIKKYISENKDEIKLLFFPKSSPFLSAIEECWHQTKRALAVSEYYETFENIKYAISGYFRTVRFKVSIINRMHNRSNRSFLFVKIVNLTHYAYALMDFIMRKSADCSYF